MTDQPTEAGETPTGEGDAEEARKRADAEHAAALARLEAEVERRRAADEVKQDRRPVERAGEHVDALVARMRERAKHAPPPEDARAYDDPEDARVRAFHASLKVAHLTEHLDVTVDHLGEDQHPGVIRRYIAALGDHAAPIRTLILTGRIGSGKTTAAIAVGNAAAEHGMVVRFVKHSTYLRWLRPDGAPEGTTGEQVRERFRRAQLLILDDLGAELEQEASTFVRQETSDLLGDRLGDGRPTVVTTNLSSEVLSASLGERMVSRLGARAHPLRFVGPDRRKPVKW